MKTNNKTNSYNIFDPENPYTILYHAIAESEDQVRELARHQGIDINGLVIELENSGVKDPLGRALPPCIEDARVY